MDYRLFKAAVLVEVGKPLEIMELVVPDSLGPGQVLVRFCASALCGAQLNEAGGLKGPDRYLPHLMGHEGAGVVERVGAFVNHIKVGDHVVAHWRPSVGMTAEPPAYYCHDSKLVIGAGPVATFAEMGVVSGNRLTAIPKNVAFDVAALMGCAVTTGIGAIVREAKVQPGESVLVIGAGGVGLSAIIGARLVGANPIAVIDKSDAKLRLAYSLGATDCHTAVPEEIERRFRVVIECTGIPALIVAALKLTAPGGGRLVLVGQPAFGQDVVFPDFRQHYFGKTIMDSQGGGTAPQEDIPKYLGLFEAERLPLDKLITERVGLDKVNRAMERMQAGEVLGRCVIDLV